MKTIAFAFISPDISAIESASGGKMSAFGDTFGVTGNKPMDPAKRQTQIDLLKRYSRQPGREGSSQTLLTGQTGVAGQPIVNRPTLLGTGRA